MVDLLPGGAASSSDPAGSAEAPAAVVGGGGIDAGAGIGEIGDENLAELEDERPRGAKMSKSEIAHSDNTQTF